MAQKMGKMKKVPTLDTPGSHNNAKIAIPICKHTAEILNHKKNHFTKCILLALKMKQLYVDVSSPASVMKLNQRSWEMTSNCLQMDHVACCACTHIAAEVLYCRLANLERYELLYNLNFCQVTNRCKVIHICAHHAYAQVCTKTNLHKPTQYTNIPKIESTLTHTRTQFPYQ